MSGTGAAAGRPAIFADRDGTLIEDRHYLADPDGVRLLPGVASAVARAADAGWPTVVVTNQSGIARGVVSESQYAATRDRLDALLAAEGAAVLSHRHCPHHPDVGGACACRKPATGMYRDAALAHGLDLRRSWYVGDRWRDVQPGLTLGGRGILVPSPDTPAEDRRRAAHEALLLPTFADAVSLVLSAPVARPVRIAVLASGGGSNLQALLDRIDALGPAAPAHVTLVISDRRGAGALTRAQARGIATAYVPASAPGEALEQALTAGAAELVVLAGYLRLVPAGVVRRWAGRIVNVHPALLPAFGGAGMYGQRVHAAVLAAGVTVSGPTVHLVDEVYDRGDILAQREVPVLAGDTVETLAARVLAAEHALFPETVLGLAERLTLP